LNNKQLLLISSKKSKAQKKLKRKDASFISFKKQIDKVNPVSQKIWDELKTILVSRELKKGEYIVKENQKYHQEIFVHEGIVRGFYRSDAGDEFNVVFYQDNEMVIPNVSRTKNERSNINLQALIPAIIFEIDQDAMKTLRFKYQELYVYGNQVQENELDRKTQREISLLVKNAEERYMTFRNMYPHLENKISQYHIASYLGITPVSLSRLRKNLAKK
jgi:CRP/FNR family transcriptional regulator, anaerobic regulatory protein